MDNFSKKVDVDKVKKDFLSTKKLFDECAELENKKGEVDDKVKAYKETLLSEISFLEENIEKKYEVFANGRDKRTLICADNDFFETVKGIYFSDDEFDFFKSRLEEFYNQKFELVSITTSTLKLARDLRWPNYRQIAISEQRYYANLLVPVELKDYIEKRQTRITKNSCDQMLKHENIFLIDEDWINVDISRGEEYLKKGLALFDVFKKMKSCDLEHIKNHTDYRNPYFKNDDRFLNAIFDTLEYRNKKIEKREKMTEERKKEIEEKSKDDGKSK